MTREEAYTRYKAKKKLCRTCAQEVHQLLYDPEMIYLVSILKGEQV